MSHLASLATPAQPPTATHHRGSRLASRRITRYSVTAQKTKSGMVVVSSCIAPRYSPQVAVASAARIWPVRPAPSRRLIAAVSTTSAASSSAGSSAQPDERVAGQRPPIARAASGVSGGWST